MKKILIFLILFAVIAVITTYVLIIAKTYNLTNNTNLGVSEVENSNRSNFKTVDLYGTFSTNGIETYEKKVDTNTFKDQINVIQINGLKNKRVEQKINNSIEKEVLKIVKEIEPEINAEYIDSLRVNCHLSANFSNVISISIYGEYKIPKEIIETEEEEEYYNEDVTDYNYKYINNGLNYNLIDGDKISIEDLFVNDSDVETAVRIALYKYWEEQEANDMDSGYFYDVHYDYDSGTWMGTQSRYDEDIEEWIDEVTEFKPKLTENEINKGIKRFFKTENNFYFDSNRLYLKIEKMNEYYNIFSISLADMADRLIIYDRYLTDENIYENDNIRIMSLITCTAEEDYSKYKESKYESDNLFYDIDFITEQDYSNNPYEDIYNSLQEDTYKKALEKIDEYKELAENNPEKAYFVFVSFSVECGSDWDETSYNNLVSTNIGVKRIECDYESKQLILDEVLKHYRYYMMGYYRTIYNYLGTTLYDENYENEIANIIEEKESHVFDVITGNEIKSVSEIFKDGIDYEQVLRDKMFQKWGDYSYFLDEYNPNQVDYELEVNRISIILNGDSYYGIDFEEIEEYLNLEIYKIYILPSNERNLYEYDIESLSFDELNLAYNEIFARHGHDFKVEKYKEYFNSKDWYEPIPGKTVSIEELTDVERENAEFLRNQIENLKPIDY